MIKRCPTCGAIWTLISERTNVCQHCNKTMQPWEELVSAPNWINRYKDVGQYGV